MNLSFGDLLGLDVTVATVLASQQGALLLLGDGVDALTDRLLKNFDLARLPGPARVLFGYSISTAPFPLLVGALMTERNTLFDKLSLFGWVEDNAILEPRAEIFGLTPFGEQPVLFLRDLDLDRPVEAWIAADQPMHWLRVAGVVIAERAYAGEGQTYLPDDGALAALRQVLPVDAHDLIHGLAYEVASGQSLRAGLRRRRKLTNDHIMHVCDGWRVLAQSVRFVRLAAYPADADNANQTNTDQEGIADVLRVSPPRNW